MILSIKKKEAQSLSYSRISLSKLNSESKQFFKRFFKSENLVYFNTLSETYFPIAKEDVNPGLSMPKRFIKPCKP